MRLEYRLVNLLGQSRYEEVQPLLKALLKTLEAKPVEVHHHHHYQKANAN